MKSDLTLHNLLSMRRDAVKSVANGKNAAISESMPESAKSLSSQRKNTFVEGYSRTSSTPAQSKAFKKIVESVIKANKRAQAGAQDQLATQTPDDQALAQAIGNLPTADVNTIEMLLQGMSAQPGVSLTGTGEQTAQTDSTASSIVRNALVTISNLLHLNVAQGFQDVKLDNPSDGLKDQLAEVLAVLKGIDGLLTDALRTNQSLTINGTDFDPTQIASAEKIVRVQTFHIELAFSMAGISGDIANRISQKNNQALAADFPSAQTPSSLSMPQSLIEQALGAGLNVKDNAAEAELRAMAATLHKSASSLEKSVSAGKIASIAAKSPLNGEATVQIDAAAAVQGKDGQKVLSADQSVFDAKTLRTLLKIDSMEQENKAAAQGTEKLNLADMSKVVFAKNVGAGVSLREEKTSVFQADANANRAPTASLFKIPEIQPMPGKSIEESVVQQMADKIQVAVKTGTTEIRLLLRPESLGEMRVKLTLDGDVVMGKIYVENQQVKHIIETNMQSLKDSLAQHNLQTGSFDVNVGGGAKDFNEHQAFVAGPMASEGNDRHDEDSVEKQASPALSPGFETGRKFGSNTVEYFA